MNYTIHQLRIYVQIVRLGSITKAADALYMSQPAISIQLKNFQAQFDIPLYEVLGRQLHITDFGMEVAETAGKVLSELDVLSHKTEAYRGLMQGRLVISSASTGKYLIPYFLSGFFLKYPGIDLVLDVTNRSQVLQKLKDNETDFGFVSLPAGHMETEEELLVPNKLYLVGNKPEVWKERPLIYREEGSATRMAMEQYYSVRPNEAYKKMELTTNEAVKQAVIAGLGNSVMPLIGIKNEVLSKQLYIIPAKGLPIQTEWRLTWKKGKKLSPVAQAYLDFIRTNKQDILNKEFRWYLDFE
ncbi:MAG: LysR family transcriptional regulator [Cyclonatronaceae bacterium]